MAEIEGCGPDLAALIAETGATHIYLHQGRGSLQPAALAGCAGLRPVYGEGEVFIFEVWPPPTAARRSISPASLQFAILWPLLCIL
jgi:hypothetical protein